MNDELVPGESELTRSVTRLGDSTEQLTTVLEKVDENQKTLLKLQLNVNKLRDKTELDAVRLETQNQLAASRNKTAVLVLIIMIVASIFGSLSYAKIRSDTSKADAVTVSLFASKNRCQIDFNTKVLTILKKRGELEADTQSNIQVLLQKIAIPGSSFEQGQTYRREYVAKAIAIQAQRNALEFPKGSC